VLFAIGLEPRKLLTMMDELDSLPAREKAELRAIADKMTEQRNGIIVGPGRLKLLKKEIGDRVTVTSFNYRGIDLEFEIVGTFPASVSRYDLSAAMNRDYLNNAMDAWAKTNNKPHPMANKSMNLAWFRYPDRETFERKAEEIMNSVDFKDVPVKCETASSGISTFLEAYRDLLWGMRWLLCPAILFTLSLVIANAISISVRERQKELAVMKVLGFLPHQILILVLGEALALGVLCGLVSSGGTFVVVNKIFGGVAFPIAFFGAFNVSPNALWWGPAVGGITAFVGSFMPAWGARTVKVSEVFSKVA
jgi:putative ABC transport system permease protein